MYNIILFYNIHFYNFRNASLFDLRKTSNNTIDAILNFDHPKALTSAFFSSTGTNMVSTCNDDHIRVFNTSQLSEKATSKLNITFRGYNYILYKYILYCY